MKILLLTLSALFLSTRAADCTTDPTAAVNKCDTVKCSYDNECQNYECEEGYCWSWSGRPSKCNTDGNAQFYKCAGVRCTRDYECYDHDCDRSTNTCESDLDLQWWAVLLIVIAVVLVLGIVAIFVRRCLKNRNASLKANLNSYGQGQQKQLLATNYQNQ